MTERMLEPRALNARFQGFWMAAVGVLPRNSEDLDGFIAGQVRDAREFLDLGFGSEPFKEYWLIVFARDLRRVAGSPSLSHISDLTSAAIFDLDGPGGGSYVAANIQRIEEQYLRPLQQEVRVPDLSVDEKEGTALQNIYWRWVQRYEESFAISP